MMNRKNIERALLACIIAGLVAAFFALDLGRFLSLEHIKQSQERFDAFYTDNRALVICSYMALYIAVTALSLPGAVPLTLGAGALFGLVTGTIVVSFASTIGATLACAASRFVLRDWVQRRFGSRLETVNQGVEREGKFYLFTLRLIPVFPFFMINLVMGLTRMPLTGFYWVSQLGMLPGTIVYVNAGKEIGQLEGLSGILSPGLLISFALIGLLPITTKKLMALYRRRRGL
jgi:uncharacterized membrane protein YdjX (TVP38/TMEM64 family)